MRLTVKVLLVVIFSIVAMIAVISLLAATLINTSYERLERQYMENDLTIVHNRIQDEKRMLEVIVSDWAPWDDTYNYVTGKKPDYIDSNLQPASFENLLVNLILITNQTGGISYSGLYDEKNKTLKEVPPEIISIFDSENPFMSLKPPRGYVSGIIIMPEGMPMFVASGPVLHSDLSGPPQGVVLMGKKINDEEVTRLAGLTNPTLSIQHINNSTVNPGIKSAIQAADYREPGVIMVLDSDTIAGYTLITDINGNAALISGITRPRDIYNQGKETLLQFILFIISAGFVIGIPLVIIIERSVLNRISSLNQQVNAIGREKNLSKRIVIQGENEISRTASEINHMLDTMENLHLELGASETRFREMADLLPQIIYEIDANGIVTYANKYGQELFGVSGKELINGLHMSKFFVSDDYERITHNLNRIAGGEKSRGEIYTMVKKDKTLMQAILFSSPIIHEGRLEGFRGSGIDISERVKLEEALAASEEKYRALTENTGDIIFSINMEGIFTYISPQINKYGFLVDEIIGKSMRDIIHPEDIQRVESDLARDLRTSAQFHTTFRIFDKWGNVYWFDEKGTLRIDQTGKPVGIYGVLRDDSDRKRTEDAIELANKKLNLMNNITRHDILNTITGLLGCVDMAKATSSPEEKMELLNDIRDLTRTIQRQIVFTKEYQEVGIHQPLWQNVNTVIRKVMQNFEKTNIIFSIDLENIEIYADPLLEKVFFNLVDNATRYGETITTITIHTLTSDINTQLIFEDNGVGIPDTQKTRIFERGVGKNTGMGLFLASEILAITGITIRENGVPGSGARFEILIPWGTYRFSNITWTQG